MDTDNMSDEQFQNALKLVKFYQDSVYKSSSNPMTVEEFIDKHGENSQDRWINHCEIMIDKDGNIYEARPSHQEWSLLKFRDIIGAKDQVEAYAAIPQDVDTNEYLREYLEVVYVWYDFTYGYLGYKLNDKIIDVVKKLQDNGLLNNKEFKMY